MSIHRGWGWAINKLSMTKVYWLRLMKRRNYAHHGECLSTETKTLLRIMELCQLRLRWYWGVCVIVCLSVCVCIYILIDWKTKEPRVICCGFDTFVDKHIRLLYHKSRYTTQALVNIESRSNCCCMSRAMNCVVYVVENISKNDMSYLLHWKSWCGFQYQSPSAPLCGLTT